MFIIEITIFSINKNQKLKSKNKLLMLKLLFGTILAFITAISGINYYKLNKLEI